MEIVKFAADSPMSPLEESSMRNLDIYEIPCVSGAATTSVSLNCISVDTWTTAHNTAKRDANTLTFFGGALVGGVIGAFAGPVIGVSAAVMVAPYIWGYTYFDSNAWSRIYSQQ